jgi:hypothetical protein
VYAGLDVVRPYYVAGKWQRDRATGDLINITLSTVTVEFDSFSNYDWGWGNTKAVGGGLNASANLVNNCWGALTSKDAWLGKKYHISSCTAEVGHAFLINQQCISTHCSCVGVALCVIELHHNNENGCLTANNSGLS